MRKLAYATLLLLAGCATAPTTAELQAECRGFGFETPADLAQCSMILATQYQSERAAARRNAGAALMQYGQSVQAQSYAPAPVYQAPMMTQCRPVGTQGVVRCW